MNRSATKNAGDSDDAATMTTSSQEDMTIGPSHIPLNKNKSAPNTKHTAVRDTTRITRNSRTSKQTDLNASPSSVELSMASSFVPTPINKPKGHSAGREITGGAIVSVDANTEDQLENLSLHDALPGDTPNTNKKVKNFKVKHLPATAADGSKLRTGMAEYHDALKHKAIEQIEHVTRGLMELREKVIQRDLKFRANSIVRSPVMLLEMDKVEGAAMQMVGEELSASEGCTSCRDGLGVFKTCVIVDGMFQGECANCHWLRKRTGCSLRTKTTPKNDESKKRRAADESSDEPESGDDGNDGNDDSDGNDSNDGKKGNGSSVANGGSGRKKMRMM